MSDYFHNDLTKLAFVYKQNHENKKTTTFLGGNPYVNSSFVWPLDTEGNPLVFFAQVDLENVDEKVRQSLNLPESGYLQFYHGSDDLMGMDLSNPDMKENVSKILYLQNAEHAEDLSQFKSFESYNDECDEIFSPIDDYEERTYLVGEIFNMLPYPYSIDAPSSKEENNTESYFEYYRKVGEEYYPLYIGGYPHFTQADFREGKNYNETDKPVLLAGSESSGNVMWGDAGAGGFWLPQPSIDSRAFDKSFIYWDCG